MSNKTLRDKVFTGSKNLFTGRILQMAIQFLMGLLVPKLVSPFKYGLWRSLMIIYQYSTFSNLGTYAAIGVKMPYLNGKGEIVEKESIKNNTFYFNVLISTIISLILIVCSNFTYGENAKFYQYGFLLFSLLIFTSNISDFFLQLFRIEKKFLTISVITVLQMTIQLFLSILLLFLFDNVLVLAVAIIFSNLSIIVYSIIKAGLPTLNNVKYVEMWKLVVFGSPLLLNSILLELIRGVDQVLIITFLRPEELGYYGLAIAIQRIGFLVPGILASTTMPYIYEEYGKTNDIVRISKIFEKSITVVALICSFLLINMVIYSELLIRYFLPKYLISFNILKILLFGMFSIGLLGLPEIIASITGRVIKMIKWQLFILTVSIFSIYFIIKMGYGVLGVAMSSIIIYFLYTIGILFITYRIYLKKNIEIFYRILLLYFPYFFLLISYFFINQLFINEQTTLWHDTMLALFKSSIILIAYAPILWFYNKKLSIINFNFLKLRHNPKSKIDK